MPRLNDINPNLSFQMEIAKRLGLIIQQSIPYLPLEVSWNPDEGDSRVFTVTFHYFKTKKIRGKPQKLRWLGHLTGRFLKTWWDSCPEDPNGLTRLVSAQDIYQHLISALNISTLHWVLFLTITVSLLNVNLTRYKSYKYWEPGSCRHEPTPAFLLSLLLMIIWSHLLNI